MLNLLRAHRLSLAASLLLLVGATALILVQPLLAGRLVDRAAGGAPHVGLAVVLVSALVTQLLLEAFAHFRLDRLGERIVLRLRTEFADHVVRLPIGQLDRGRTGELLARGTSDTGLLRDMPRAVGDIAFGVLTLAGAGVFMLSIDAVTLVVAVVVIAVTFVAGNPFLTRIQHASVKRQAALGDYTAGLDRTLGAARTVKLFGAEGREVRSIGERADAAFSAGVRVASSTAINVLLIRLGVTGAVLAIVILGGSRVANGALTIGQFVSLFAFAVYAIFPITAGFAALAALRTSAGAYQHLTATLRDLPEGEVSTVGIVSTAPDATAPFVEFDHVSFAYGTAPVLRDVSFTLGRDEVTALVGPSGSGKSTILALLCRFHDPLAGAVRWDGRDVRATPLAEYRSRLGLLEQDAPVLYGTVRENLLIADPAAGEDDLWRVLGQANMSDDVARLPEGLDTPVLERGRGLSGGQRQRLALARAFLSRSQLILMDEPTAHLDRVNEYDVMANLVEARGERSVLVVAHRLSTVADADRILVLRDGAIQATGTHAELLTTPLYRELVDHELSRD